MVSIQINGDALSFEGDDAMPLLWFIREQPGLKGTKFGCGIGSCGACTVHVDGRAVRSCITPMASVDGASITTIEGLAQGDDLHPVQQVWLDEDVAQCGYCQAGQIMAAVGLLASTPEPTDADIDTAMTNLCRCGTYYRIRRAIKRAAAQGAGASR